MQRQAYKVPISYTDDQQIHEKKVDNEPNYAFVGSEAMSEQ